MRTRKTTDRRNQACSVGQKSDEKALGPEVFDGKKTGYQNKKHSIHANLASRRGISDVWEKNAQALSS